MSLETYFLNSSRTNIRFETIQISHSAFSQTYSLVANAQDGLTATLETAVEQDFEFLPYSLRRLGLNGTLDQGIHVDLGDLGQIIREEVQNVRAAKKMREEPIVTFRSFQSVDLTQPLEGPFQFRLSATPRTNQGASFDAAAKFLNVSSTGIRYGFNRFPMLRAYVV